ncbi:MAG: L,D-transpeptidase family protein [Mycobacterium sp.]|nr:L,D-transpeptidase family protein [Mycobacterium sp.]
MPSSRARTASAVVGALLLGVLGSDVAGLPGCRDGCKTATATAAAPLPPAPPKPPVVGVSPFNNDEGVNPLAPVAVDVLDGTISSVSLVDDWGNELPGTLSPDRRSWHPADRLNFARSYSMTVNSKGASGVPLTRTSSFSTLVPNNYAHPYLEVAGGLAIHEEQRYGIGTVITAHFDEPIADKALAEKHMVVKTEPPVAGSWFWVNDQVAHWRPQHYYTPGTRVSVDVKLFGLKLGEGLYGQADAKANFTIGDAHVAVANDITKQISVFNNGRLVRTMPTSMGRGGTAFVAGQTFSWWTPPGVYTVIDKGETVTMDSASYGLPNNSAWGYKLKIPYATRISLDGIYMHQLDETVWAQGNTNLSHGCLNLNGENAKWFFDFAQPGDVVEVRFTGGPPLTLAQNGDWTIPWEDWVKGSALTPKAPPPPASPAPAALSASGN